jgi:hypothetical protein
MPMQSPYVRYQGMNRLRSDVVQGPLLTQCMDRLRFAIEIAWVAEVADMYPACLIGRAAPFAITTQPEL